MKIFVVPSFTFAFWFTKAKFPVLLSFLIPYSTDPCEISLPLGEVSEVHPILGEVSSPSVCLTRKDCTRGLVSVVQKVLVTRSRL